jgi:hypothetical protein
LRASGAALERIIHWLNSNNERASLAAATLLLDRAWGNADIPVLMPSPTRLPHASP